MNTIVVLASCALLSTPLFAKGMVDHLMKSQHQFVSPSANHPDLSGHWVGRCDEEDEIDTTVMDLKQSEAKLSMKMRAVEGKNNELIFNQKFEFTKFKVDSKSSPKVLEHSYAYADWRGENQLYLDFKHFLLKGNSDNYRYIEIAGAELELIKEGDKITVKFDPDSTEDYSCSFHKESKHSLY